MDFQQRQPGTQRVPATLNPTPAMGVNSLVVTAARVRLAQGEDQGEVCADVGA